MADVATCLAEPLLHGPSVLLYGPALREQLTGPDVLGVRPHVGTAFLGPLCLEALTS